MSAIPRRSLLQSLAGVLLFPTSRLFATPVQARPQFLYVLKVAPQFHQESAWTGEANKSVGQHFARLQKGVADGVVILAGRTTEPLDQTFGLVVFEADDEAAARAFMNTDPAVVAGTMTATLHPYAVALLRK